MGTGIYHLPIGFTAITLGAGSAMDGHGLDAAVFQEAADFRSVDLTCVPPDPDFGGDGNEMANRLDDFRSHFREQGTVLEQG